LVRNPVHVSHFIPDAGIIPDPSPGRTWGELQIGFFLIVIPILRFPLFRRLLFLWLFIFEQLIFLRFLLFRWLFLFIQQHLFCSGKNGNL